MRAGVLISAVGHVGLVALALLGTPKLFDTPTQSIEVDLVRAEDVPKEEEKKPPEEETAWDIPQEPPAPWPDWADRPPPPPPPDTSQQAALVPQPESQSQVPAQSPGPSQAPPQQKPEPSIFDPVNIPKLLDLPTAAERGFDAESTTAANLTSAERAAFKAHVRKCWKLPAGVSPTQTTRIVLRIHLRRNGVLATEPVLIEASASRDGPLVVQAALRAVKDCQPFGFLPDDRYGEWRVLDMSFTPRDMAGG